MAGLSALDDLAAGQRGYFTRAQAVLYDVEDATLRRSSERGRLATVGRGVYRFAGAPEHPHEQIYAAWMSLSPRRVAWERAVDPDALVFGRSALIVYGVGDLVERRHEFAVPTLRRSRNEELAFRKRSWGPDDWRVVEGMTVARLEWVLVEAVRSGEEPGHLADALADARRLGLVDEHELSTRLSKVGRSSARAGRILSA
jgi:predicted transcriptional regulator of viral defense system